MIHLTSSSVASILTSMINDADGPSPAEVAAATFEIRQGGQGYYVAYKGGTRKVPGTHSTGVRANAERWVIEASTRLAAYYAKHPSRWAQ
jgi:hypothetical protein